jgi:hypothetical protein
MDELIRELSKKEPIGNRQLGSLKCLSGVSLLIL